MKTSKKSEKKNLIPCLIFSLIQQTKQTREKSYFVYDPIYFGSLIFGCFFFACDFVRLNFHLERHRRHKHKINRTEQCVLRYRRWNGQEKNRYIPPYHQLIAHTVLSVCVCVKIVWYETLSHIEYGYRVYECCLPFGRALYNLFSAVNSILHFVLRWIRIHQKPTERWNKKINMKKIAKRRATTTTTTKWYGNEMKSKEK